MDPTDRSGRAGSTIIGPPRPLGKPKPPPPAVIARTTRVGCPALPPAGGRLCPHALAAGRGALGRDSQSSRQENGADGWVARRLRSQTENRRSESVCHYLRTSSSTWNLRLGTACRIPVQFGSAASSVGAAQMARFSEASSGTPKAGLHSDLRCLDAGFGFGSTAPGCVLERVLDKPPAWPPESNLTRCPTHPEVVPGAAGRIVSYDYYGWVCIVGFESVEIARRVMGSLIVRCRCPHCSGWVVQLANRFGPTTCPHCLRCFEVPRPQGTPLWIWGVVVVLVATLFLQI